jgi:EF hand
MKHTTITSASFLIVFGVFTLGADAAENPLTPSYRTSTWRKDMTHDFKVMDTNRDGKVDMAEWQAHTNPLHPEYAKSHAKPDRRRLK